MTEQGRVECDTVVNATGMWGAETAAAGRRRRRRQRRRAPVRRDREAAPTSRATCRRCATRTRGSTSSRRPARWSSAAGRTAPARPGGRIPRDLGPELFAPDHERFEPLGAAAGQRIPLFAELGIQTWVNGPIPFSPDAEPLMGVTEDLDNLFHCCGFSAGIAAAGGAGQAMANWIIDGDPGLDLWPFDVRRFGPSHNVPAYLQARSVDAYEHYYDIAFPNRELTGAARPAAQPALRRPRSRGGAVLGHEVRLGAGQLVRPGRRRAAVEQPTFAPQQRLRPRRGRAPRRAHRASGSSTRARSPSSRSAGRAPSACCSGSPAPNLDVAGRQDRLHPAAQRARRHRGRRHDHPARRATASTSSPAAASAGTT